MVGREDRTGAGRAWFVYRLRDKSGAQRLSSDHLLAPADTDGTCFTGDRAAVERWAQRLLEAGRARRPAGRPDPNGSVFTGDCHGASTRKAGGRFHVAPGDWIAVDTDGQPQRLTDPAAVG